ncbi:MAG TPA: sugar phosphate isomerase/epimerase [Terriglobia bacterium]|nr:sugar phosphate isomerase/epimerase [Terriglobia bacterium]
MSLVTTRRGFLGGAAAGLTALAAADSSGEGAGAVIENEYAGFKLGVATYSFREFQRGLAIKMTKDLQTPYVSVKEFHLPYCSTPQELAQGRKNFESAGLKIMSGGNVSLEKADETEMRKYFEYARACGMPMIVCAPVHENLKLLEKFVKEYNIKAAIHNHGPEDKNFPSPQSVLEAVKDLDPRVGLCMDVGHTSRTGADIVKSIAEAGPRLLDMHMKDLKVASDKDSQCDVGEGVLPILGIFKQLQKIGYHGCVDLEYEIHEDAPLTGMLKSFAYMRGLLAAMAA